MSESWWQLVNSKLKEIQRLLELKNLDNSSIMIGALLEANALENTQQRLEFRNTGVKAFENSRLSREVFRDLGLLLCSPGVARWEVQERGSDLEDFLAGTLLYYEEYGANHSELLNRFHRKGRCDLTQSGIEIVRKLAMSQDLALDHLLTILRAGGWSASSVPVDDRAMIVANWPEIDFDDDDSAQMRLTADIVRQGPNSCLVELGFLYQNMTLLDCKERAATITNALI